jgi:replicative DNA helicase
VSLPHSEEVEAALVARLLVDPDQLPVLAGKLHPEDFYVTQWRQAYEAMQRLSGAGRAIDITTLQDALQDRSGELGQRIAEVGSSFRAPVDEYAGLIRRDAFRRRLIGALDHVIQRAYEVGDREVLLAEVHDAVVQVSQGVEDGRLISPDQAADAYLDLTERRAVGLVGGLNYGFSALDRVLNPARGGEMIVLAARPSVGKTAMAEMVADTWSRQSADPVLFVSLEMSLTMLLDRSISRDTGLPAYDIIRGHLDETGIQQAKDAATLRRGRRVWYLDDPFATTNSVRAMAAKLRILAGGLSGIVVDYLQLLKDAGDQEVQRVTKISRQIKAIAREFEVPLLVLSQLSRAPEMREDPHPRLSDLRESGAIEQDADAVIGLYRPLESTVIDVEVLKQRQGMLGRTQLYFDNDHVRFMSLEEGIAYEIGSRGNAGLLGVAQANEGNDAGTDDED